MITVYDPEITRRVKQLLFAAQEAAASLDHPAWLELAIKEFRELQLVRDNQWSTTMEGLFKRSQETQDTSTN